MASPVEPSDVRAAEDAPGPSGATLRQVPSRPPGRGLATAGALVGVVLVLAVLKPWAWTDGPSIRAVTRTRQPVPTASALPDTSAAGLAATICLGTEAWQVASLETWRMFTGTGTRTQSVRVWRAISPVAAAASPTDPTIPTVVVAATEVRAIGWCAPSIGPLRGVGPAEVTIWRVAGDVADVVTARRIAPAGGETPFAALYREVTDCVAGFGCSGSGVSLLAPGWTPGRYVFRYADAGSGLALWFGADVEAIPGPSSGAAPPGG